MLYVVMEGDDGTGDDAFGRFFAGAEPRLRRALVAGYGPNAGRTATIDALGWAWEHWDRIRTMRNPVGYLYRVGQTAARRALTGDERQRALARTVASQGVAVADPAPDDGLVLAPALRDLSLQQRTAVVLVHGYGLPLREVADTMEISVATVRTHVERALDHLRTAMEATDA